MDLSNRSFARQQRDPTKHMIGIVFVVLIHVLVIYALCGVLAVVSILLSQTQALWAFLAIVLAGGLVLYLASRRAQEALDARSYPDDEPTTTDGIAA